MQHMFFILENFTKAGILSDIIPPQFASNGPWSITYLGHVPSLSDRVLEVVVGWLSFRNSKRMSVLKGE